MATTNPVMPKVATPLPSLPGTAVRPGGRSGGEGNKDRLLADLRRQVIIFVLLSIHLLPFSRETPVSASRFLGSNQDNNSSTTRPRKARRSTRAAAAVAATTSSSPRLAGWLVRP
jgi:hypothetical protein